MLLEKARRFYEKGLLALLHCNLPQAQKSFFEAASFYHQGKTSLNFLNSAICYHLGGDPSSALQVSGMISTSKFSEENKKIHGELLEDIKLRMHPRYLNVSHTKFLTYQTNKDYMAVLVHLKDDPWIFGSTIEGSKKLAMAMCDACLALKMEEVAVLFKKDLANLEKQ